MPDNATKTKRRQSPKLPPEKESVAESLRPEYRTADELNENPANWREHPTSQLGALREVIDECGWAGVVLYNERTKRLIDGHARKKIARSKEKIPVLVGDWTEEQERKILLTLDPIGGMATANKERGSFEALDDAPWSNRWRSS